MIRPKYPHLIGLSNVQRYGATAPVAELAIFAPAGSGKTAVLAARAVHLVEAFGVHPSRIVAFTFTRAAAAELRARVVEIGGEDMALLRCSTFHAFALGIVRADPVPVGAPECFTVATEDAVQSALASLYDGPLKRPEARRCSKSALAKGLGKLYAEANMPEGTDLRALIGVFLERLREFGLVPAGILPAMAVAAIQRSTKAGAALSEVSHVLIDEAHDCSRAELTLARMVAAQVTRAPGVLSLVLDPRQAIYGWRGGLGVDVALGIAKDGVDAEWVDLKRTYRFGPAIAAVADRVAVLACPDVELAPTEVDPHLPSVVHVLQYPEVQGNLEDMVKAYGPAGVAILVRSRREAAAVVELHGPQLCESVHDDHGEPAWVKLTRAACSLLVNPADNVAFRLLYEAEEPYVSARASFESFARTTGRARFLLAEYLRALRAQEGEATLLGWIAGVESADEVTVDAVAARVLAFDRRDKSETVDPSTIYGPALDRLGILGRSIRDACDVLAFPSDSDRFETIAKAGRVAVSTVHAAKGREWPGVIVATAEWPWRRKRDGTAAEEWRTFFVAITRAKSELAVAVPPDVDTGGILDGIGGAS